MDNKNQPASPLMMQKIGDNEYRPSIPGDDKLWNTPMAGLTKREWFAGMALAGLSQNWDKGNHDIALNAVLIADEVMAALEKQPAPDTQNG